MENAAKVSQSKQEKDLNAQERAMDEDRNELMAKAGQLTIENDWLKKEYGQVFGTDWETKSGFKKDKLSVTRQCGLLEINRTSVYYTPAQQDRECENKIKNRLDYWHCSMPVVKPHV